VEAVPLGGVSTRSLHLDIPGSVLRVRRDPNLREEERYKVALNALRILNARYSFRTAFLAACATGGVVTPFEHIRKRGDELTFAAFTRLAGPQAFENKSVYALLLLHLL
jgi:hypothetical protein